MFSGITQGLWSVQSASHGEHGLRYGVTLPETWCQNLQPGASVAVDGVCQTVVKVDDSNTVFFDAIPATCQITTLGRLQNKQMVSIERSLRLGDECGGHTLSGHVHGTAEVIDCTKQQGQVDLLIQCPCEWLPYLLPKGYVAINGSSLTIAKIDQTGRLTVHLIPETCRLTRLGQLAAGEQVNVELDQMTVTIVTTTERILAQRGIS